MKEKRIISAAGRAFSESWYADKVNPRDGVNYNRSPFITGFVRGVRFYANYLYQKHFIHILRSITDTKDTEEERQLEEWEAIILYTLKSYPKMQEECDELKKTVERLTNELSQAKARHEMEKVKLTAQIKDLEYWLATIGKKQSDP